MFETDDELKQIIQRAASNRVMDSGAGIRGQFGRVDARRRNPVLVPQRQLLRSSERSPVRNH